MYENLDEIDIRGEWVRARTGHGSIDLEYGRVRNIAFDSEGQNFMLLVELYKPAGRLDVWKDTPNGKLRTWAVNQVILFNEEARAKHVRTCKEWHANNPNPRV